MLVLCLGVLFCQCFCLVEDSSALCGVVVCVCVSVPLDLLPLLAMSRPLATGTSRASERQQELRTHSLNSGRLHLHSGIQNSGQEISRFSTESSWRHVSLGLPGCVLLVVCLCVCVCW